MARAIEHIRYLVDIVGYRPPTSEGERWASRYIQGVFKKLGLDLQVEPFYSHRTFSYPYMIIFGVSILGGLLFGSHPVLGFLLSALAAAAFYLENTCRGHVSRMLPRDPSQNVVARIPAAGEARRRVVVCAHYDTSRTGASFHPRLVKGLRRAFLFTILSVMGMPLFILLGAMFWSGLFGLLRTLAVLWLAVNFLLLLHREVYGKNVHGANDNGSGTGVLLALAESLTADPLANTEVWLAATGCEEAGMVGMLAFLERHEVELRDAFIVNLDNLGAGSLKYITGEGMLQVCPSDPELLMLSAEVCRENPDLPLGPHEYRTMPTDAYAALVKGFRALSVMAFDADGVIPNWHWETDVIANLDERNLLQAERFVTLLLKKIDAEK
ncbi:MAG: M28 family peptidase [bacterium]